MTLLRVAGLIAAAGIVGLAASEAAHASCLPMTAEQQQQRATVVFEGVALEGATASGRRRFRVDRYVKGGGGDVITVATGVRRHPDGTGVTTSVSVEAAKGERWLVFAAPDESGGLTTSVCEGSRKIAAGEAGRGGSSNTSANGPGAPSSSGAPREESGLRAYHFLAAGVFMGLTFTLVVARRRVARRAPRSP
jgi:hypothetical protein